MEMGRRVRPAGGDRRLFSLSGLLCVWCLAAGSARASSLFVRWRPLDVVQRLESSQINPSEAFRALEAVKRQPVESAVKAIMGLHFNIERLYGVLKEMSIDPLDAYSALDSWLHSADQPLQDEEQKLLAILKDLVDIVSGSSTKGLEGVTKSVFDLIGSPERLFDDIFNKKTVFVAWKTNNPSAFEALRKNMCDNFYRLFGTSRPSVCAAHYRPQQPVQPQPQQPAQPQPQQPEQPQPQQPAQPQPQQPVQPQPQQPAQPQPAQPQPAQPAQPQPAQSRTQVRVSVLHHHHPPPASVNLHDPNDPDLQDPLFADTTRYNRIHDETHVFHKSEKDPPSSARKTVHNVRRYFDNQLKVVIESIKTIEHHDSGLKRIQKNVRTLHND